MKIKSNLKWSDVFEVYRKIREVEHRYTNVNYVAGTRVAIIDSEAYQDIKNLLQTSLCKEKELLKQNKELLNKIKQLQRYIDTFED